MKKSILYTVLIVLFFSLSSACQKKEEPKRQPPFTGEQITLQNDLMQLKKIVEQDPQNTTAWIQLGNLLMDTSRFHEAIDAYQKALELDQDNVDVRVDMGTCYRRIGKSDQAIEEYKKAIAMNPKHLNARRNLGIVLAFDFKNKQEGIRELEEYLKLSPDSPDAHKIRQLVTKLKSSD